MKTLTGTKLSNRYRLWEIMHAGSAASLYLAYDGVLERKVVVKLLNAAEIDNLGLIERFEHEARLIAKLKHENIVAVIDIDRCSGVPFIVLEYVEGESLEKLVRRHGPCAIDEAIAYTIEVARALCVAHAEGVAHGGLSSEVIFFDKECQIKIVDFGVYPELSTRFQPKSISSPEQAIGKPADAQTDIYCLGIVLFELLAGLPPFVGTDKAELATSHIREQLPDIQVYRSEVSATLAAVIERMTEKDPTHRYHSAAAVIDDLEDALTVETARAGKASPAAVEAIELIPKLKPEPITKGDRRHLMKVGAIGSIGAFTLALILALLNTNTNTDSPERVPQRQSLPSNKGRGQISGAAVPIELVEAHDYDPLGDGHEHPQQVNFAIDRNPDTKWTTDSYFSGKLSKRGVGIYFKAASAAMATDLVIKSATVGWKAEIYRSSDPPATLPDPKWQQIGEATIDQPSQRIHLASPQGTDRGSKQTGYERKRASSQAENPLDASRYYLIWITQLPLDSKRVEISDVQLIATRKK